MANLVTVEANNILTASVGAGSYTAFSGASKLALITTTTPSTASAAGSEVSGGSYARQTVSWGSASAGAIANSGVISFTNMPAVTSVGGVEIWDSSGTPVRKWFGTLSANKTTSAGDTISFAIGALSVGLS